MIGYKTMEQAKRLITELLDAHQPEINQAYLQAEEGITVGLSLKIEPNESKSEFVDVTAGINFVALRVKDQASVRVSENQESLFAPVEKLRPRKGSSIDKITISNPKTGDEVTLEPR